MVSVRVCCSRSNTHVAIPTLMEMVPAGKLIPARRRRRAAHGATEVVGNLPGAKRRATGDGDDELVAAVSRSDRIVRQACRDDVADGPDGFRSDEMAVLIVERLEAIDVEDEHADRRCLRTRLQDQPGQAPFERAQVM